MNVELADVMPYNKNNFGRTAAMKVFAELASRGNTSILPVLIKGTRDKNQLVRYNATRGLEDLASMGEAKTMQGLIRGLIGKSGFVYGPARGGLNALIQHKVPVIKHLAGLYGKLGDSLARKRILAVIKDYALKGDDEAKEFLMGLKIAYYK